ncbi:hypothetical protein ACI6QG_03970 [Roseococcus sp. DSY-14]|uniref:hypothetical protein n=1 Tax=Roseococcus sp. DSY-14 TaxID=3369650 RepID=UPI00387B883B
MATQGLPVWPLLLADAASLPPGESLLLDAARGWAHPGPAGPMPQAALVLAAAGAEGAALPLDGALRRLGLPGLAPPLCPRMRPVESDFLLAVAAAQGGRRSVALALLARLAPPLAAYRAMPDIIALALALRRAGVALAPRL